MHQAQAEFRVLADGPLRPAAGAFQRRTPDHRHGAVLDDRVALVAMVHADAEEAVVLPRGHAAERVLLELAVRLRALHHGHLGIVEIAGERGQPVGAHLVVGVDHRHHVGFGRGFLQAEVQRAGLVTRPRFQVEETEALAELFAVRLHRLPHRRVLGVVVDHQHFVVLVIQRGQRIERDDHHLRRLVVAGQVDRHERLPVRVIRPQHAGMAHPLRPPQHLGELEAVDQQDRQDRDLRREQQREHGPVDPAQVEVERQRGGPHDQAAGELDQRAEEEPPDQPEAAEAAREQDHRQQRQQARRQRLPRPGGVLHHRPGQRELQLTVGVEHAPVRAGAAFAQVLLPRLVERFEQVVVDVRGLGPVHPVADEDRLVGGRRVGVFVAVAVRRPADLADHHVLAGKALHDRAVGAVRRVHRVVPHHAVPEREQVDGDVVHVLRQLGVLQPDVVRLGDRHRLAHRRAHAVEVGHHLLGREVVAEQHLVAHDHPGDRVRIGTRLGDQQLDLAFVVLQPLVDLRAGHHLQPLLLRQPEHLRVLLHGVGADVVRIPVQQLEIGGDLLVVGIALLERALVALEERHGEAADLAVPVVRPVRVIAAPPQCDVQRRREQGQHDGGEQRIPAVGVGCGGAQKDPRRSLRNRRWSLRSLTNAGPPAQ